eukprot:TRINITY_DN1152_c0_g1_i1.p1 TRINITY_DN1152_c0_g1~~TRINITY_DN1152_c0_g1_i1.p1  ORF type:complete len:346 (+),score=17.48 TRINITY_DN1152_c0_g1_i1:54-1091(+)
MNDKRTAADVLEYQEKYEESQAMKDYVLANTCDFIVSFVLDTCLCEKVGTMTTGETESALNEAYSHANDIPKKEAKGIFNALKYLKKLQDEIDTDTSEYADCRILGREIVLEVHLKLLEEVSSDKAGKFRETTSTVRTYDGRGYHYYPRNVNFDDWVAVHTDTYNASITSQRVSSGPEKLELVMSAVAKCLLDILTLHPFSDGNGRLCRLLVSYGLSQYCPVPVPLVGCRDKGSHRNEYLASIIQYRTEGMKQDGLKAMTELIRRSLLTTWETIFMRFEDKCRCDEDSGLSEQPSITFIQHHERAMADARARALQKKITKEEVDQFLASCETEAVVKGVILKVSK